MSAASEKAAREWRERGGEPACDRWYVRSRMAWEVFPPCNDNHDDDVDPECFPTHAEAIAYADKRAREASR